MALTMAPLIPLLVQAATIVPGLLKFFNAGEKVTEVAEKVSNIAQVISGDGDPEVAMQNILAKTELRMKFQLEVNSQMLEWERMYLADLQSARERDVKLIQAGVKNHRANVLAALAIILVIFCLAIVTWMSGLNEFAKGSITLILGRALGWVEQIFSFEFGTTKSSKTKDDTINTLSGGK